MSYIFYLYDRWGKQIGTITGVYDAVHTDEVNGEDSLSISTTSRINLEKGQRILWRDKFMVWHEHTISEVDESHENGKVLTSIYAENSMAELLTDYVIEKEPSGTASAALARALEGTRWQVGSVDVVGEKRTSWYHVSAYEAVTNIAEVWGGEISATIEVDGPIVTSRKVNINTRRGGDHGRVFTYGRSLSAIRRKVDSDDVCTALYGYGKGIEKYDETGTSTGGYSRKLTFGSINGGKDWVGDEDAKLRWGLPDGRGGIKHTFGQVEFSDCEDPTELLALTKEALKEKSAPRVTYTGDVVSLAEGGYTNGEDTRTGDSVFLRDKVIDERVQGRALRIERDLLKEDRTVITLGNLSRTFSADQNSSVADLDWLKDHVTNWDMTVNLGSAYLNAVINNWNEVINATGGYVYWEQGEGITVYDKPIDQNPTMAIQLRGGSFRIANSKLSNGDWDWRTIGTGDGFVAEMLIAGTIKGGSNYWNLSTGELVFKQGGIYDLDESNYWNLSTGEFLLSSKGSSSGIVRKNDKLTIDADVITVGKLQDKRGYNYWNLDTGDFYLRAASTSVDGSTLGAYVKANDSFHGATPSEVFNKLTNNGAVKGIVMQGNNLYINASYINTGVLTVASGGQTLFSADKTTNKVTIANFDVSGDQLLGPYVHIGGNNIEMWSSTTNNLFIGRFASTWLYDDASRRYVGIMCGSGMAAGIVFGYGASAVQSHTEGQTITPALTVAAYTRTYTSWMSTGWNFYASIDMHNNWINNAVIPTASSLSIGDAVQDKIDLVVVTKVNDDGTIAEYAEGCSLEFENGILVGMTKPEE